LIGHDSGQLLIYDQVSQLLLMSEHLLLDAQGIGNWCSIGRSNRIHSLAKSRRFPSATGAVNSPFAGEVRRCIRAWCWHCMECACHACPDEQFGTRHGVPVRFDGMNDIVPEFPRQSPLL
jgi:hypothetical protein